MTRAWVLLGFALLGAACVPDRQAFYDAPLSTLPAVAVGGHVAWVDRNGHGAMLMDLASVDLAVRRVPLPPAPTQAVARSLHAEMLVLCRGERGEAGVEPEPGALLAAPTAAQGEPSRRYTLGSRFTALAQTDDGRYAVAYFRGNEDAGVLFNPNEIAIVDLDAAPSDTNPVARTVRSFGGVPNDIVFSPPMVLAGVERRLAVVLSDSYVTLLDLDHLDRSEITVPLTLPDEGRTLRPAQLVFDPIEPAIYVRSTGSDDIHAMRLVAVTPEGPTGNDFRPSLSQLGAGRGLADMALYDTKAGRRLLVVAPGSRELSVVDVRTSRVTTMPLDGAASRIVLFDAPAPDDPETGPRALLLGAGGPAGATFVDLEGLEDKRGRNVDPRPLAAAAAGVIPRLDRHLVIALHSGSAGLSVIDLVRRTAAPILAEVPLDRATYGGDLEKVWIAPVSGARLGYLDLTAFAPGEIRLDAIIRGVVPVDVGAAHRVVVIHDGGSGHVTVLDGDAPTRESARTKRGFLLEGVLDRRADP